MPIFVREPFVKPGPGSELKMIRYNNDDRAPLSHLTEEQVEAFYKVCVVCACDYCFFFFFFFFLLRIRIIPH